MLIGDDVAVLFVVLALHSDNYPKNKKILSLRVFGPTRVTFDFVSVTWASNAWLLVLLFQCPTQKALLSSNTG